MKMLLICLLTYSSVSFANPTPVFQTYYLHLEGTVAGVPPEAVLKKLHDVFLDPLGPSGRISTNSYVTQVWGAQNHFIFNLTFEPLNETMVKKIEQFVADRESLIVLGNQVSFQKVTQIKEIASLLIGYYDGTLDDAFVLKYNYPRAFEFKNLDQWLAFSNEFGFALLSSHENFKSYIESFIKDMPDSSKIPELLTQNDMTAIDSNISLVLENGSVISQDFEHSPFTRFRFFRSCYLPQYENGKCF